MSLIPIYWWNKEVHNFRISQDKFSKQPWAQGVVLLACVAIAMLLANLPFTKHIYHAVLETQLFAGIKSPDGTIDWNFPRGMTVEKFINDNFRKDISRDDKRGLDIFVAGDQVLKGAALNAVQIAELL